MRRQIASKPKASDKSLPKTTQAAIRLASIGLLLNRPKLTTEGLGYAEAAIALDGDALSHERTDLLQKTLAVYRRAGKPALAQALAVRELSRAEASDNYVDYGIPVPNLGKRAALVELVGLYGAEGRHADVLALLDESTQWSARDLAEFIAHKDSLKTPVGFVAARALSTNGNREAALSVTRELLDQLPAYDPAYALFIELVGDRAIGELDTLYARDEFEERPLIWKAHALATSKKLEEAEKVIRQAIAIDPSDGEQGKDDRLHAYAVLADVMEAKGDTRNAALYRRAIEAIRVSEHADDFYAAGLYDRAFAMYRDALSSFSDAYCIQSRLAVQLTQQGRHAEALAHYRRAYELMPDSFGRVESHCFGCESVFRDSEAQGIAEDVFEQAIEHDRQKPQAHYLLGYLREEQGRLPEAVQLFRTAVSLDDKYLNAWKHLHDIGDRTYLESDERDIARFRLLRLDPRQRHVRYELTKVRNLTELWNQIERVKQLQKPAASTYRLRASADMYDAALEKLPPEIQLQMTQFMALMESMRDGTGVPSPQAALSKHAVIEHAAALMGASDERW
jgi:tetratricopeptide (TPR) repeat protein